VVVCEPAAGLSNRIFAVASCALLALVAGAELRLSPRAVADLAGPGAAFAPPPDLLAQLACGRSRSSSAEGCHARVLAGGVSEGASAADDVGIALLPTLSLKSNRELEALFWLRSWDPRGPPRLQRAVSKRHAHAPPPPPLHAANLSAIAGSAPLLALHPDAHLGLVVATNQWLGPLLFDKPFALRCDAALAAPPHRWPAQQSPSPSRLKTCSAGNATSAVTTLRAFFDALAAEEAANLPARPGASSEGPWEQDPLDVVTAALYRPAPAVRRAFAAARAGLLGPRLLVSAHLRSAVLLEALRGPQALSRIEAAGLSGAELKREEQRRLRRAARCAARRVVGAVTARTTSAAAEATSVAGKVFVTGDNDLLVAELKATIDAALQAANASGVVVRGGGLVTVLYVWV
jgi:hypothetical protein